MIDFFLTGVSRWPQGVISIWKWYVHRNIFGKAHVWKISQPSSEVFYPSMEKVWNSSFRRGKKINSYILYILLYLVVRNQGYESWKKSRFFLSTEFIFLGEPLTTAILLRLYHFECNLEWKMKMMVWKKVWKVLNFAHCCVFMNPVWSIIAKWPSITLNI